MTDERKLELRQYYSCRLVRNYFKHEDHLQVWPWSGWGTPAAQIRCFNGKKKIKNGVGHAKACVIGECYMKKWSYLSNIKECRYWWCSGPVVIKKGKIVAALSCLWMQA